MAASQSAFHGKFQPKGSAYPNGVHYMNSFGEVTMSHQEYFRGNGTRLHVYANITVHCERDPVDTYPDGVVVVIITNASGTLVFSPTYAFQKGGGHPLTLPTGVMAGKFRGMSDAAIASAIVAEFGLTLNGEPFTVCEDFFDNSAREAHVLRAEEGLNECFLKIKSFKVSFPDQLFDQLMPPKSYPVSPAGEEHPIRGDVLSCVKKPIKKLLELGDLMTPESFHPLKMAVDPPLTGCKCWSCTNNQLFQ